MKKTHSLILSIMALILLCVGVGYISYSYTLSATSTSNTNSYWKIVFKDVTSSPSIKNGVLDPQTPIITDNGETIIINPIFFKDGEITYYINIENRGYIDGTIEENQKTIVWDYQNDDKITINYTQKPFIEKGTTESIIVKVRGNNISEKTTKEIIGRLNYIPQTK